MNYLLVKISKHDTDFSMSFHYCVFLLLVLLQWRTNAIRKVVDIFTFTYKYMPQVLHCKNFYSLRYRHFE